MPVTINGNGVVTGFVGVGKVLQVKSYTMTATASGTTWWTDVGLDVVITPSSTSSKILVFGVAVMSTNGTTIGFTLYRNGSAIDGYRGDAASNRPRLSSGDNTYTAAWAASVPFCYLDSPASTSALTYDLRFGSHDQRAWYINRTQQDSDSTAWDNARHASTITAMEIGA